MDSDNKYRNEYENYPPYKVYYHKSVKYHFSHERFVVPWQLEESNEENKDTR